MIIELPKKFYSQFAICEENILYIRSLIGLENLMYDLTKALKRKKCVYCGKKLNKSNYTLDHRYPRNTGGISITNNLFPCCDTCNSAKSNLTHSEYLSLLKVTTIDRKKILKKINEHNQKIFKTIGFKLPKEWVIFESICKIRFINPKKFTRGKKYRSIEQFYSLYKKLPRPIIVDKNYFLLEGYNLLLFAKDNGISEIPIIIMENVEVQLKPEAKSIE